MTTRTKDTMRLTAWQLTLTLLSSLLIGGCSGLLPHGETKTTSQWQTYESVKGAYDQITVNKSRESDLLQLGFTPERSPNMHILNHLEIVNRVMPHQSLSRDDLPAELLACLGYQDGCRAYEIKLLVTQNRRYGNFFADFLNFRRKTHLQGWSFNAVFVLQNDLVVYKVWKGTPNIDERSEKSNPLGPLQDIGGDAIKPSIEY